MTCLTRFTDLGSPFDLGDRKHSQGLALATKITGRQNVKRKTQRHRRPCYGFVMLRMPATHKVHQVLCLPLKTQRDLEGKQQRIAKSLRTLEKCNSSTIQDFKMYFCKVKIWSQNLLLAFAKTMQEWCDYDPKTIWNCTRHNRTNLIWKIQYLVNLAFPLVHCHHVVRWLARFIRFTSIYVDCNYQAN